MISVFRTHLYIYDGVLYAKMINFFWLFLQKAPSKMFDRVLITSLTHAIVDRHDTKMTLHLDPWVFSVDRKLNNRNIFSFGSSCHLQCRAVQTERIIIAPASLKTIELISNQWCLFLAPEIIKEPEVLRYFQGV